MPPPLRETEDKDFDVVFDKEDYLSMVQAHDESAAVLRAHLVLEEFLNVWAAKITATPDLFAGGFISFKNKLQICQNLGLEFKFCKIAESINEMRNGYSHRRKYELQPSKLNAMAAQIDGLPSKTDIGRCKNFEIALAGTSPDGQPQTWEYTWATADSEIKV